MVDNVEIPSPMSVTTFFFDQGSNTDAIDNKEEQKKQNLQVYKHRPKVVIENPHVLNHDISSTPSYSINSCSSHDDINLPIGLRNGVHSCVQYPIANYVSYDALSSSTHSFALGLSSVVIP